MNNNFESMRRQFNELIATGNELLEKMKAERQNTPGEWKRWRAEEGDTYFYASTSSGIAEVIEYGDSVDDYRYETGNYFQTEDESVAYRQHLIDLQTLKDDTKGYVWKPRYWYWCVELDVDSNELLVNYHRSYASNQTKFSDREDAEASIANHKDVWLRVLGVEKQS